MMLALSEANVNLLATVLGLAVLFVMQRLEAARNAKSNEKVLQTTRDTNASVGQIHKLSNSAFGAAKRAVAVSKRNNAISLRTLASIMRNDSSGPTYAAQADVAETEAQTAEKEADDHDRLQASVDQEIKDRADKAAMAAAVAGKADPTLTPVAVIQAAEKVADAAVNAAEVVKATNPIPKEKTE